MNHLGGNNMKINKITIFVVFVLISIFTYGENKMIMENNKLNIELSYKGKGIVTVQFLNISNEILSIPCYKLFSDLEEDVLEVHTLSGKKIQYIGKLVKRDSSFEEECIYLKSNEKYCFEINIAENYKIPFYVRKLKIKYSTDLGQTDFIEIKL